MLNKKLAVLIATIFLASLTGPAWATYESIQGNLADEITDTFFDVDTGQFSISQDSNAITLNDPTPLGGTITNGTVNLETWFSGFDPVTGNAQFTGGSFMLTFDFDGTPYEISGPIEAMVFETNVYTPSYSTLDGEGLWTAATTNLPGSNDWPDGGEFSSIKTLTMAFNEDLTDWAWDADLVASAESLYTLWPDDTAIPEPASLVLVALGSLMLYRRRR
jgi:hypothetical protein